MEYILGLQSDSSIYIVQVNPHIILSPRFWSKSLHKNPSGLTAPACIFIHKKHKIDNLAIDLGLLKVFQVSKVFQVMPVNYFSRSASEISKYGF